jgi:hypothetical protein
MRVVKERPLSILIDFSRTLGIKMPEIKKRHVEGVSLGFFPLVERKNILKCIKHSAYSCQKS